MSKRPKNGVYIVQLELTETQREMLDRLAIGTGASSVDLLRILAQKCVTGFLEHGEASILKATSPMVSQ